MAGQVGVRTWNGLSLLAGGLGLLAVVSWLVAGPAALVVGYLALVQINHGEGRQRGRRLALAAMILGGLACVAQVVWFVAIIFASWQPYHTRTVDANHLRQIGVGLNVFHDQNGNRYPTAVSPRGELPVSERLSWQVLILPYLEQQPQKAQRFLDLAGQLDLAQAYSSEKNAPVRTPLRAYQSPNAPEPLAFPDATSYVGLAGLGEGALGLPPESPQAGFFGYPRRLGRDDIKFGTSFLSVVVESTQGGPWGQGGVGTAPSIPAGDEPLFGPGRPFGGLQREGFHLLFADGSVSFRRTDMPAALFREHALLNRRE